MCVPLDTKGIWGVIFNYSPNTDSKKGETFRKEFKYHHNKFPKIPIILKNWHQKITVEYNRAIMTHHFNVENSNWSETIVMQVEGSNSFSMVLNYCTEIGCYSRVKGLLHKTKIIIKEFKQAFTILNFK